MLVEVTGSDLMILIQKFRDKANDWVVLDNFRLTYFGTEKPSEEVLGVENVTATPQSVTGKIYNLQGQEMKTVTKGIYIYNGKKYIKR